MSNSPYFDNVVKPILKKIETKGEKVQKEKEKRVREIRREASRLVSMANKRLQRLESNKLIDSPAYKSLYEERGKRPRFGIRGKDFNEVQKEMARMRRFLDSATSTVRGANRVLKEMAKNTGIKYKNLKELKEKASQFFELASKVEQYLRNVEDMGSVYDSTRIFGQVKQYVKQAKIDLSDSRNDVDGMVKKIVKAMDIYNEQENFYYRKNGFSISGWYQLDDE